MVALVLDGGSSRHGIESTIVDLTTGEPVLLRPGAITVGGASAAFSVRAAGGKLAVPESLRDAGLALRAADGGAAHFLDELARALSTSTKTAVRIAVLARSVAKPTEFAGTWIDAPGERACLRARELYANLRTLDTLGADEIWIETPPDGPDWVAVNDRLRRGLPIGSEARAPTLAPAEGAVSICPRMRERGMARSPRPAPLTVFHVVIGAGDDKLLRASIAREGRRALWRDVQHLRKIALGDDIEHRNIRPRTERAQHADRHPGCQSHRRWRGKIRVGHRRPMLCETMAIRSMPRSRR